MASSYKLLIPDVVGCVFMILDLIADIAFVVHLHKNDCSVMFPIALTGLIFATITTNVLAAIGIEELGEEMLNSEISNLKAHKLMDKSLFSRMVFVPLGAVGLLPHVLLGLSFWVLAQNKDYDNERTNDRLKELFQRGRAPDAVKEVQSVLESGVMIYLKSYYIFIDAILYRNNWPLILGLSFNVLSMFFGLRNDLVPYETWKPLALLVAVVNLSLRMTIILILGNVAEPWTFFVPIVVSASLLLFWGSWLYFNAPLCSKKIKAAVRDSAPNSFFENCMSSIVYSLFLVPSNFHNGVALFPFAVASIVVSFIDMTPLGLKIVMPFAGTVGQVPYKVWWKIFRVK